MKKVNRYLVKSGEGEVGRCEFFFRTSFGIRRLLSRFRSSGLWARAYLCEGPVGYDIYNPSSMVLLSDFV